ncbi:ribonuclease D [Photobacterium carnosum]|uniref:Ribonuclease D n=1 Tax=Photobacterium carnosum TaxID=2023717 RepID=A0A2N4UXG0_9GAMM|nr:ribonuclease D [Photobacterium carnosum]MBY3787137.1 ribonuclease D [Photobacterium carnosum]MCD9524919.1 ribonuclease D [Photobacterium carnosum]MCD9532656.1 ribonuclease D [Photobacterium carnosum]MCD9551090.1 ribonuclease D [Photobacterium carnosum]PLC59712.1 ribonuclease D [Photobacterium carnosum]
MNFEIVTTTEQLRLRCELARQHTAVMLDTEFVRTRTLYPRLGLIQMFDGEYLSLIDPLNVEDMEPLWALLRDQSVIKVLHACGEDLEVFLHHAGCLPVPMLDTQIMAAFLGHGISTGFGALVKEYVGVELDKGEARTNWLARPLTDKQLDYAAADVHYLKPLYETLLAKVEAAGYMEALQQECNAIMLRRTRVLDPNKAYLDIKNAWQLTPKQLAILQQLAAWRVREARKRDIALNFIVKELHLWKLAHLEIKSRTVMEKEGFEPMEIQRHCNRLLKMVHDCDAIDSKNYPQKIERLVDFPGYKQMVKRLKDVVTDVELKTGLAPEFLASKKQIHQLLSWAWKHQRADEKRPEMLKNWRKPLFEARALAILDEK